MKQQKHRRSDYTGAPTGDSKYAQKVKHGNQTYGDGGAANRVKYGKART